MFARAGVPLEGSDWLAQALDEGDLSSLDATAIEAESAAEFEKLALSLDQDPFDIHREFAAMIAMLPGPARVALAENFARQTHPALREAALGFLLDADDEVAVAALAALVERAASAPRPARTLRRLVAMRAWLPPERRVEVDAALPTLRALAGADAVAADALAARFHLSLCDGDGGQALLAAGVAGDRRPFASVTLLGDVGVVDAWHDDDMELARLDELMAETREEVGIVEVPREVAVRWLAHGVALTVERGSFPPFATLRMVEMLGVSELEPAPLGLRALIDELLNPIPEQRRMPAAVVLAHDVVARAETSYPVLASWFEIGDEARLASRGKRSRATKVAAFRDHLLSARRAFWAERCAWMAFTLKAGQARGVPSWEDFALVAADLARAEPPVSLDFFDAIAVRSLDVLGRPKR